MQPALRSSISDASLAVFAVNGGKPHQGFAGENPAPNRVREVCNSTVLLGMRGQAELNRIGSCCTGKERDSESGNDYFGARYYASTMGRFLSPDWSAKEDPVPYAQLDDPQSLNLYSYVRNNPLTRVDADGHVAGADDAVEVTVGVVILGALAAEAGVQYYNHTPEAQRSLDGALSAAKENFTSNVQSVKNTISGWFSKKTAPAASTGPKAATAPGVTAGGQATDEHGNRLGPSGKPQVNKTKSNTRKGAQDKALSEGSGTVEHSTPTVGRPHFHPTGADGEKKPSSTHHEYPN